MARAQRPVKIFIPFTQNDEAAKIWQYSRLCWWQGSHIARKGPNFSKSSTRGLWHTVRKKRVCRETQLPKYDPLLANPPWKLYWSRNYVTKKIQFYGLIFSKSFLLLIYQHCKHFIQSEKKSPKCFNIFRPASPIPFQPQMTQRALKTFPCILLAAFLHFLPRI